MPLETHVLPIPPGKLAPPFTCQSIYNLFTLPYPANYTSPQGKGRWGLAGFILLTLWPPMASGHLGPCVYLLPLPSSVLALPPWPCCPGLWPPYSAHPEPSAPHPCLIYAHSLPPERITDKPC